MLDIEELELEFNAFYGDKENEHTLLARMFPLIEEVKRLRELIKEIAQHDAKEYWSYELLQKVEMIE